jgi:aspartokinase-like uncharacterized kinase
VKPETLVKVGGSLIGWTELVPELRFRVQSMRKPLCLLFGGGVMVDVLRDWDRTYQIGENSSHWLAIEALDLIARTMLECFPDFQLWSECHPPDSEGLFMISPSRFCKADAVANPLDCLPEHWSATSDSIALRMATVWEIPSLVLCKTTVLPTGGNKNQHGPWGDWVDPFFDQLAKKKGAPQDIQVLGMMDPRCH